MINNFRYSIATFFVVVALFFAIDQSIKHFVIVRAMEMYHLPEDVLYNKVLDIYKTHCINLRLIFNDGIAFSMFSFLHGYLKWIQLVLIVVVAAYVIGWHKDCFMIPSAILIGAGSSNIFDRFLHGGVVDYVYWHCGFNFAVFNFADVMIDIAIVWIMLLNFIPRLCNSTPTKE